MLPRLSSPLSFPDGVLNRLERLAALAVLSRHHLFPASTWTVVSSCPAFLWLLSSWPSFLLSWSIISENLLEPSLHNHERLSVASSPDLSHPLFPSHTHLLHLIWNQSLSFSEQSLFLPAAFSIKHVDAWLVSLSAKAIQINKNSFDYTVEVVI